MRTSTSLFGGVAIALLAAPALATPVVNGALLHTRIFNDFPDSNLSTINAYPGVVQFLDENVGPDAFANRHNFRVSDTGGASDAIFANGDAFSLAADVTLLGTGPVEGGLQISPWWSPQVDGAFNIRLNDGEIACFGGRMPFFSFTGTFGLHYAAGTTIRQEMIYTPNGLSAASPATIEYRYTHTDGNVYSSGLLAFDEGNPNEPFGTWGMLDNARVGGFVQVMNFDLNQHTAGARFENIVFTPAPGVAGLAGLVGLAGIRRRR